MSPPTTPARDICRFNQPPLEQGLSLANAARFGIPSRPKRWALFVVFLVVASQWVRLVFSQEGDFRLHWNFGQRLLHGEFLYLNGVHTPYPPLWGLWCVPTTLLPLWTSWLVWYPIGLVWGGALIWALVEGLRRAGLTPGRNAASDHTFWTVMLGLALGSRYVIRELPENGVNLMIVALTWLGLTAWRRGCDLKGGAALGLAVALKCTPVDLRSVSGLASSSSGRGRRCGSRRVGKSGSIAVSGSGLVSRSLAHLVAGESYRDVAFRSQPGSLGRGDGSEPRASSDPGTLVDSSPPRPRWTA